ncbi:MAG: polyprenyl synthetase family protein [Candidatus Nanosalina sp.]
MITREPEVKIAEETLRFLNPAEHHPEGKVDGPPKRLRPSMTRWVGKEMLDEDPEWDNILLSQGQDDLREDYDDPEAKYEEELERLSLAAELKHNYTLSHDDVVDNDDTRRGAPTVWRGLADWLEEDMGYEEEEAVQKGQDLAINLGDWLNDISTLLVTKSDFTFEKRVKMLEYLQEGGARIAQGQDKDLKMEDVPNDDLNGSGSVSPMTRHLKGEDGSARNLYLDMIEKKTSVLYGTSAGIGALAADADEEEIEEVARYGTAGALAFQIRDDMNELLNAAEYGLDSGDLGKKATDVPNGKTTLAYETALENTRERLEELEQYEDGEVDAMVRRLELEQQGLEPDEIDERIEDEYGEAGYGQNPGTGVSRLKDEKRPVEHDTIMLQEAYGDEDLTSDQVKDVAQRILSRQSAEDLYDDCSRVAEDALQNLGIEYEADKRSESEALYGLVEFMQNRDW